jgi:hypothetical protein
MMSLDYICSPLFLLGNVHLCSTLFSNAEAYHA